MRTLQKIQDKNGNVINGIMQSTSNGIIAATADTLGVHAIQQGRLSLTTGVATGSNSDVANVSTLYFTPYLGNLIGLKSQSTGDWTLYQFSELSTSISGLLTANTNYDIFVHELSNVLSISAPVAWTNDTTRATALTYVDGVLVNSSQTWKRYIGTIRANSSSQLEDSRRRRYVWNQYNKVSKHLYHGAISQNVYNAAVSRAWAGDTSNFISFVVGENQSVPVSMYGVLRASAAGNNALAHIGLDVVPPTYPLADLELGYYLWQTSATLGSNLVKGAKFLAPGYHAYWALQYSNAVANNVYEVFQLEADIMC